MKNKQLPYGNTDSMVFAPSWDQETLAFTQEADWSKRLFLVPENQKQLVEELQSNLPAQANIKGISEANIQQAVEHASKPGNILSVISRTQWSNGVDDTAIVSFFSLLKSVSGLSDIQIELVVFKAIRSPAVESVTFPVDGVYVGLMQTLAKEFPNWKARILVLSDASTQSLAATLSADLPESHPQPLGIGKAHFYVPTMKPASLSAVTDNKTGTRFRKEGTYLIIGGNSGIGSLLAHYLAENYQANLIIISRSIEQSKASVLLEAGARSVSLHRVDLCDGEALHQTMQNYPHIHGVIHSALVLQDASLANMDADTLFNVLRPKVHGTRNLVEEIKDRAMDFCLFFSSIQSYIANAGQANYSAACVAKDAFAELLNHTFMHNTKVINWAFWGNVGIVAKPQYREIMQRREIGSIEAGEGLAIIERFLRTDLRQITVIKASDKALRELAIEPHVKAQKAIETATENTKSALALAKQIIPTYDVNSELVKYNESMSEHLQRYSRWKLSTLSLPAESVANFSKLFSAIQAIKAGHSIPKDELLIKFPELKGHLQLVDTCLDALPEILRGEIDPLSIIFPEGSFHLVEPVYRDNPIADYFNQKVAEIVVNFQLSVRRPVRILEIGAGTGSTTQFVLPNLNPEGVQYTFTDLSFAFLNKARKRFSEYDYIDYKICNIENPPEFEQAFDVIIATNVIHATADLPKVLANVRQLTSSDGIFVLNEITSLQDYATLTFGLTEGWWLSIDDYRIPNSPLLNSKTWQDLIIGAGFEFTDAHGNGEQQVIVGFTRSDALKDDNAIQLPAAEPVQSKAVAEQLSKEWVQDYVSQIIMEIMHIKDGGLIPDQPFSDMGIDSLIALELLKPLKDALGYVPTTVLFEYPTLNKLTSHLLEAYQEPLAQLFAEQSQSSGNSMPELQTEVAEVEQEASVESLLTGEAIAKHVSGIIAEVMVMKPGDIHPDIPFHEYGIDSLIALELLKPLREVYGYLPATLLFEYPTLSQLTHHLMDVAPADLSLESEKKVPEANDKGNAPEQSLPPSSTKPETTSEQPNSQVDSQDIAIIGLSAQLPECDSLEEFWQKLAAGESFTSIVPDERWDVSAYQQDYPVADRGSYTQSGAFMRDIDCFDHRFFRITPAEAERMDPQERLFLQQAYLTMLDAGLSQRELTGSETGVFVGVMNGGYAWYEPSHEEVQPPTSLFWSIANRVSYVFGWHGPSMAIDTACSSSLTALHLAAQSLRVGECDQAIVGGVNVISHPRQFELLCGLHMLSPSDKCRPFGQGADGFVDGEGIIALMLKPLTRATSDGHCIRGIIKGSAVNAGGHANGYTAPNPEAQSNVIKKALERSGVSASEVSYVEAHGTGTELGDPIEFRALNKAYSSEQKHNIALGSVKSNIGHLESAAGASGLLKILLQMQHKQIVPSINAEKVNPHLAFEDSPFTLNQTLTNWEVSPRIAGVSSFGAGGANAHVIISQGPETELKKVSISNPVSIPLSHHTASGLQQMMTQLALWLDKNDCDLATLAYRLSVHRDHFAKRVVIRCQDLPELKDVLSGDLPGALQRTVDDAPGVEAYLNGEAVDWLDIWNKVLSLEQHQIIKHQARQLSLPNYIFMSDRHWIDAKETRFLSIQSLVNAHRINGECIAPAAWSMAELLENALKENSSSSACIENVIWRAPISDPQHIVRQANGNVIQYLQNEKICMQAEVSGGVQLSEKDERLAGDFTRFYRQEVYARFSHEGYQYGRLLQGIQWADIYKEGVRAFLTIPHDWGYQISPALLDSALQLAMLMPRKNNDSKTLLPYSLGKITVHDFNSGSALYAECFEQNNRSNNTIRCFNFYLRDEQNQLVISLEDLVSVVVDEFGIVGAESNNAQNSGRQESTQQAPAAPAQVEVFDL